MGKKKSKCMLKHLNIIIIIGKLTKSLLFIIKGCCVYRKPLQFGESSSESDDEECDNCSGHVERKKKNRKKPPIVDSIDNDQPANDEEVDK